jgi:MerR family transcriptional regulator, light-induced transcriptional regulator
MNARPKRTVEAARPLTIGALSRATRIPVETLRTWERRYGSPMPIRKPSGHRLYPAAAVEHLRRVGRLLVQGHRPGEILALSLDQLDALLSLAAPELARAPGPDAAAASPDSLARSIAALIEASRDFDREALMQEFRAHWVRLGPLRFLQELAGPFMIAVGLAWKSKSLEIRHEHFATAALADFLGEVRVPYDRQARGARVVAAMLPGDGHEGGLLMASVVLAVRGCRVVYLGPNTPVDEIAAAARTGGVEAVALSVSSSLPAPRVAKAVAQLRGLLPPRVPIWAGGAGAPRGARGVERFDTLATLDARLAAQA